MKSTVIAIIFIATLSGCASMGTEFDPALVDTLTPGMSQAEVVARLGPPNGDTRMADGRRILVWMYSEANMLTGKSGARSVSMIFDKEGKLTKDTSTTQTEMRF